jgi:membrane-associated protein
MSIDSITPFLTEYRYWLLIPLAFLEGPVVSLVGGFLSSLGYFNPLVVITILLGKDISVDAVCYAIGRWGNHDELVKRYARKIGITENHWGMVERLWHEHPFKTMFTSKLAYGLSLAFLISAGLTRISYKKFWFYAVQISLLQYGGLMLLGYYFGDSLSFIKNAIDFVQIAALVFSLVVIIYYLFSNYMRTRLMHNTNTIDEEKKS